MADKKATVWVILEIDKTWSILGEKHNWILRKKGKIDLEKNKSGECGFKDKFFGRLEHLLLCFFDERVKVNSFPDLFTFKDHLNATLHEVQRIGKELDKLNREDFRPEINSKEKGL